jgi:hypothetical protein
MLGVSCLPQLAQSAPLTLVFAVVAAEIVETHRGREIILGEWCGEECGLVV